MWTVVGIVTFLAAVVGYLLAEDIRSAYARYEDWVCTEVQEQLRFLDWRVRREQVRRLLRVVLALAFALGLSLSLNPMGGLFLAGLLGFVPVPWVRFLKARRWRAFDEQFLDGVNLLRNALKSGMAFQQAMEVLVREMRGPVAEEFDRVLKEVQLGRTMDDALLSCNERMQHPELDLVVSSVVTLRKMGGNLSETFEVISTTIQERMRVEGKIRAMTAQGMTQAYVLVAMPFILGIIMFLMDPGYMSPMFSTVLGWLLLSLIVLMVGVGWLIIRKIVTIEV